MEKMEEQKKVVETKNLTPEEAEFLTTLYNNKNQHQSLRFGPKGYIVMKEFEKYAADVYNMQLKSGDIFVTSFQRSGTTWTQELVWLIAKGFDYKTAEDLRLTQRYHFLERASFYNDQTRKEAIEQAGNTDKVREVMSFICTPATKRLAEVPSPRFVKTHLPMSLLPPKLLDTAKVIYIARDPRDVIVSCYHHTQYLKSIQLKASFKELWKAFTNDLFMFTPYFEHVKEAWALRDHPNMLFLFYEDLSQDLPASIRRVADFLGKNVTPEQVDRLSDHLNIKNFMKNQSVNNEELREFGFLNSEETFIRKGKIGGWRGYFDKELQQEADQWISKNLRDTDLCFPALKAGSLKI